MPQIDAYHLNIENFKQSIEQGFLMQVSTLSDFSQANIAESCQK